MWYLRKPILEGLPGCLSWLLGVDSSTKMHKHQLLLQGTEPLLFSSFFLFCNWKVSHLWYVAVLACSHLKEVNEWFLPNVVLEKLNMVKEQANGKPLKDHVHGQTYNDGQKLTVEINIHYHGFFHQLVRADFKGNSVFTPTLLCLITSLYQVLLVTMVFHFSCYGNP